MSSIGTAQIDPSSGKRIPYVSLHPDQHAVSLDFFAYDLSRLHGKLYIYPPFNMVSAVLAFARESQVDGVLVCPAHNPPLPVWTSWVNWSDRLLLPLGSCEIRSKTRKGFEPFRKVTALVAVSFTFQHLKRKRAYVDN
jgi:hypothetical protein